MGMWMGMKEVCTFLFHHKMDDEESLEFLLGMDGDGDGDGGSDETKVLSLDEKCENLLGRADIWVDMWKANNEESTIKACAKAALHVNMYNAHAKNIVELEKKLGQKYKSNPGTIARRKSMMQDLETSREWVELIKSKQPQMYAHVSRYYRACRELREGRGELIENIRKFRSECESISEFEIECGQFKAVEERLGKFIVSRMSINNVNLVDEGADCMVDFLGDVSRFWQINSIALGTQGKNGVELNLMEMKDVFTSGLLSEINTSSTGWKRRK